MATWTLGLPLPAQWAALVIPDDVFLIPFQADLLVGIVIEHSSKCFNSGLEFRLKRQEAEGKIGQAKFGAELAQAILETSTADAQCQAAAGPGSVKAFEASL